jgi:hypothetical protein
MLAGFTSVASCFQAINIAIVFLSYTKFHNLFDLFQHFFLLPCIIYILLDFTLFVSIFLFSIAAFEGLSITYPICASIGSKAITVVSTSS